MRIIYFDIDCLRPDHLGCYGYQRPTSPAIDRIAAEGTCFDHYYCASSPCLPARTAWSSGRFGIRSGVISNLGAGARFNIETRDYGGPQPENDVLVRQALRQTQHSISLLTGIAEQEARSGNYAPPGQARSGGGAAVLDKRA